MPTADPACTAEVTFLAHWSGARTVARCTLLAGHAGPHRDEVVGLLWPRNIGTRRDDEVTHADR